MDNKVALIVGASGLTGGFCLKYLLENQNYSKVISLGRRNLNVQHKKLEQHIVNFDDIEEYHALLYADEVFCCLGTTIKKAGSQNNFKKVDFEYPYKIAQLAQENGTKHFFLVSAMGANAKSMFFYNRVKGELENAIIKQGFEGLHIFRPSLLLGNRTEQRMGEKIGVIVDKILKPIMRGKLAAYKGIKADNVAKAMLKVAQLNKMGNYIYPSNEIETIANENYLS